jgi:ribosome biogenesis protein BRX1
MRMRHLMADLEALLPHVKKGKSITLLHSRRHLVPHSDTPPSLPCVSLADAKLDSKHSLHLLNELADLHSCNNTLYFEARRHEDLYLWASKSPNGPSVKMHVQNVHTMDELKMTGNCLKGSRGIVSFDGGWDQKPEWALLKELLTQVGSLSSIRGERR